MAEQGQVYSLWWLILPNKPSNQKSFLRAALRETKESETAVEIGEGIAYLRDQIIFRCELHQYYTETKSKT